MLTITEAAAASGRNAELLRRKIRAGSLPATKTPGGWLLPTETLALLARLPRHARRTSAT